MMVTMCPRVHGKKIRKMAASVNEKEVSSEERRKKTKHTAE